MPCRFEGIQSKLGILAPDGSILRTRCPPSRQRQIGQHPHRTADEWQSGSLTAPSHRSPIFAELSHEYIDGQPNIDHRAISTAPVSDAGTIAILNSAGTPTRAVDRLLSFSGLERRERPSNAPQRIEVQPGRFLVGPDENRASAGRMPGGGVHVIKFYSHPYR
jgi:hypothetical protein